MVLLLNKQTVNMFTIPTKLTFTKNNHLSEKVKPI